MLESFRNNGDIYIAAGYKGKETHIQNHQGSKEKELIGLKQKLLQNI